jgi:hypothetical protein
MKLRVVATITINIAALIQAVGASFSFVGDRECVDSAEQYYDPFYTINGQTNNITSAYNWCLTAPSLGLVGVGIHTNAGGISNWLCYYDIGSIDQMQANAFKPDAFSKYIGYYAGK